MSEEITQRIDSETEDEEDGFLDWAGSVVDDIVDFGRQITSGQGNRGPAGSPTNMQKVDRGTINRSASRPPATLKLDPIRIWAVSPPKNLKKGELKKFMKKFELGPEVYDDLGLAGQIAKKFLKLPYRTGKIVGKNGQYELVDIKANRKAAEGLVCSSFANIFGAIWFAEDRASPKPVKAIKHSVAARQRERLPGEHGKAWKIVTGRGDDEMVLGETDDEDKAKERARLRSAAAAGKKDPKTGKMKKYSLSAAQIYASMHGGSLVNVKRLQINDLVKELNKDRLYAVISYKTKGQAKDKGHVLFLIHSDIVVPEGQPGQRGDWVVIHSTGGSRASGGKGGGPGIYRIPRVKKSKKKGRKKGEYRWKKWYQAFDWGPKKPTDPNFDWDYVS
jgi:hypothetical protein